MLSLNTAYESQDKRHCIQCSSHVLVTQPVIVYLGRAWAKSTRSAILTHPPAI